MKKIALLFTYFFLSSMAVFSQNKTVVSTKAAASTALIAKEPYCATDQLHNKLLDQSSSYLEKFNKMNTNWQKWAMDPKSNASHKGAAGQSTQAYQSQTLPVVFHMMLNTTTAPIPGTSATDANLTKPQIQTALAKLNQLYAGTAVGSKAAGLNMDIQFCLAEVDNFGNAITSYTYSNPILPGTIGTLDNTNQAMITQLSNVVQTTGKFPSNKYINIYVVEDITSPVAGFAYLPSAHGLSFDGIYIEAQYLLDPTLITATNDLANNMTVLTHEMGHYLGMFHTFGICNAPLIQACSCDNNNCLFNGDMVCDTPPDFSQGGLACGTFTNTCNTDATATIFDNLNLTSDVNDLTDNYMDYGNWNCQHNFTIGQRKRMHFMIDESIGPRNSLLNSNVCNTVCVNTTCTVSINPITTTSVSGINLPNAVILAGASVNYNFTANACTGIYNAFNWSAINLSNNTTFQTGTSSAGFNVNFTAIGNYRILLTSSMAGSIPLCFQTATLDIQVLPPANCPANLDMTGGWLTNWQRIQYEGGWARTANNGTAFTFPTTTLTTVPSTDPNGTLNTDPFSMVTTLSADPNFSGLALPAGVSNVMRVGKLITSTTTLPAGDAAYVTYTFSPTNANSKLRVYYLGMKEQESAGVTYPANFSTNFTGGNGFGFVCKYDFPSVTSGSNVNRGLTHTGLSGSFFGKNDLISGGMHCPVTAATFSTAVIGGKNFDQMKGWQYMDLDFSEFICASSTITVTFFARSDNASNLGFHHSYSYFAAQCLPGNYKDIDMALPNFDIGCAANVGQSCVNEFLPMPYVLNGYDNGGYYNTYNDMLKVTVDESNDNIVYTPTSINYSNNSSIVPLYYTPFLNLCKSPGGNPYKYYKITYKNLCQTITNTVTIFQGFVHHINACYPDSMSGGNFINDPIAIGSQTVSPDKYVQYCGTTTLNLTPPCWWVNGDPTPVYKWQRNIGSWIDLPGETSATLSLNGTDPYVGCVLYKRIAKFDDPYCGTPIWIDSDIFSVINLKANSFSYNIIGPDVCGNSPATINLNNIYELVNTTSCDLELNALANTTPTQNTITISFFSNSNCIPTNSISASSGPSVLTYTYINSLMSYTNALWPTGPINTSFTFNNNGIFPVTGTAYIVFNVVRYGCASSFTLPVTIKIKPSAIAGTITTNPCLLPIVSITGDNTNTTGYSWQYSYNSAFTTTLSLSGSTINSTSIPSSMFTSYPVYIRRVANGTTDCPNPAYSNTLTVVNNSVNLSVSASTTICSGSSATLTASGASTYTWLPGSITNSTAIVSPTATTIYTVTGTNATACTATSNVTVTVAPTPTVNVTASSSTICSGSTTTLTASGASTYTWMPGGSILNPLTVSPSVTTVYTVTGKTGNCTSVKIITITVIPTPTINIIASATTICIGSSATLTASGSSTYTWTPGGSTVNPAVVSPSVTTVYTVTRSSGGCIGVKTITINVVPKPIVSISALSYSICSGSSSTITAAGALTYTWMPGGSTLNPLPVTPSVTTVYTVTGTNSNGCTGTSTVTIFVTPIPTVNVSASSNTICSGSSATLTSSGASTYTWLPGGSTINPIIVSPTATTIYTVIGNTGNCSSKQTITITVVANPTITTVVKNPRICAGSTVALQASGALTYTWMPGNLAGSSVTVSPIATTIYTVTGTNSNGCIGTAIAIVTVNPLPVISITASTNSICSGSSATFTATPTSGLIYSWLPGGATTNTLLVTPTVTTIYTVTGKNELCSGTKTIALTVVPLPTVTITGNTVICSGSSTTLTASGGGTYLWSNGASSFSITPNLAGVYTVTVTNGGCTAVKSVTTIVNALPVFSVTPITSTICAGTNVTLTAIGATTYTWMPGNLTGSSVLVIPTITTTYSITGTNSGPCVSTKTVIVNVLPSPIVSITGNTVICAGSSTTLTATGGGTYLWSTANLKGSNNASVTVSMSGVNTVTVTGANGCITIASISTTVLALPVLTVSPTSTTICSGTSVTLNASGALTYTWMPGGSTINPLVVSPLTTAVYTVIGKNNNCSATKTISINVLPSPTVTISGSTSFCFGSTTTLTATGGGTYLWTLPNLTGSTSPSVVVGMAGVSMVTVTSSNGCKTIKSVTTTVIYPPTIAVTPTSSVAFNGSNIILTASGAYSYTWMPGSMTGSTVSVSPLATTVYTVTGLNFHQSCPGTKTVMVTFDPNAGFIGNNSTPRIEEIQTSNVQATNNSSDLSVFPNPSNGVLNIVLDHAIEESYTIELFDMFGKLVYSVNESNISNEKLSVKLNLQPLHLAEGIYLINVNSNKTIYSNKIRLE